MIPAFRILLGDEDLSPKIRTRLIALSIREARGEEADQLDITIDDTDGQVALPPEGAILSVSVGWQDGGLVPKGSFKVDEVTHLGPPDQVIIRARAADFTAAIAQRREQSWDGKTLGDIVGDIAKKNGLTPAIGADLAARSVGAAVQNGESDIAFLRRLGREHDAVAAIKDGRVVFKAKATGTTVSGSPQAAITIRRSDGASHSFTREKRDDSEGVTAKWHDRGDATRKTVTIGKAEGAKRLSRTYASEADARRAAQAEAGRLGRDPVKLSIELACGRPEILVEQLVTAVGFKAAIDAIEWVVTEVTHKVDRGGLTSSLQMERAK